MQVGWSRPAQRVALTGDFRQFLSVPSGKSKAAGLQPVLPPGRQPLKNRFASASLVKIIIRGIRHPDFHAERRGIARGRRRASSGLNPLNRTYAAEYAGSRMPACAQKQPRNVAGARRIRAPDNFTGNLAAVAVLPRWPRGMASHRIALRIRKHRLGPLQIPHESFSAGIAADVDLNSSSVRHKYQLFTFRNKNAFRHPRTRNGLYAQTNTSRKPGRAARRNLRRRKALRITERIRGFQRSRSNATMRSSLV